MGTFTHLQRKSRTGSTPAAPTSSFLRPSRPFAPLPTTASQPVPPIAQEQLERAARFGHSFERISILPPEKKNTTGLPDSLKAGVEQLSGMSVDDVRVHYNSSKPAEVAALAYTQGKDIHVGPGQEQHLPHEAWHVAQQMQGRVKPTLQAKGVTINDDERLEQEAESMGRRALHPEPIGGNEQPIQAKGPANSVLQRVGPELATQQETADLQRVRTAAAQLSQFIQANTQVVQNVLNSNVQNYNNRPILGSTVYILLNDLSDNLDVHRTAYGETLRQVRNSYSSEHWILSILQPEDEELSNRYTNFYDRLAGLLVFFQPYKTFADSNPALAADPFQGGLFSQIQQIYPGSGTVQQEMLAERGRIVATRRSRQFGK